MYLSEVESVELGDAFYVGQTREETEATAPKVEKKDEKKKEEEKKPLVSTLIEAGGTAAAATIAAKGAKVEPVSPAGGPAKFTQDGGTGPPKTFFQKYGMVIGIGAAAVAVPTVLWFVLKRM